MNPNKPSKIRRVCNAAARFAGNSLNEVLVPGPDLLSDLIGILVRFRLFKIGLSADIEAMFMQVDVPEHEQRFLGFCDGRVSHLKMKHFNTPGTFLEQSHLQLVQILLFNRQLVIMSKAFQLLRKRFSLPFMLTIFCNRFRVKVMQFFMLVT